MNNVESVVRNQKFYNQLLVDHLLNVVGLTNYFNVRDVVFKIKHSSPKFDTYSEELVQQGIYVI